MKPRKWTPVVRRLGKSWLVDCGNVFGERIRRQFADEAERDAFQDEMILAYKALKDSRKIEDKNKTVLRLTNLPESDRSNIMSAVIALEKAGGNTQTLIDAVDYYVAHILGVKLNRTVEVVVDEYVKAKLKAERRPRTVNSSRLRLKTFREKCGTKFIHEVSTADCEAWIDAGGWTGLTRNDQRRELFGLFKYSIGRGYCKLNPVEAVDKVRVARGKPSVFTVEQVRTLLSKAAQFVPEEYIIVSRKPLDGSLKPVTNPKKIEAARAQLVPYIAIGLFCGLRPENELRNLDWANIKFDADRPFIRVDAETSKVHAGRDIMMPANLIEWLTPYRKASGTIGYSRKRLAAVVKNAELTWSPDVMRHSYGSYHLAHGRNVTETAHQMGSSPRMIRQHYENLRTAKEGQEFFEVVPVKEPIKTGAFARAS